MNEHSKEFKTSKYVHIKNKISDNRSPFTLLQATIHAENKVLQVKIGTFDTGNSFQKVSV